MKLIFLLKRLLTLLFISLFSFSASAQQWDTIGVAGFSDSTVRSQSLSIHNHIPYVAYVDAFNANKLSVQKYNGSSWVNVGGQNISAGAVIDLDLLIISSSNIYVAYVDVTNGEGITVKHYDGTSWNMVGNTILPSISGASTRFPSLAYTATEGIHVAYDNRDYTTYNPALEISIMVKMFDGVDWIGVGANTGGTGNVYEDIIGPGDPGYLGFPDLDFRQNVLHIAYVNRGIEILWNTTSGWSSSYNGGANGFASANTSSASPDLAFAPNGDRYIAFSDGANGRKTTVAKHVGSSWITVGTSGISNTSASEQDLVFDNYGNPYLVQKQGANRDEIVVYTFNGTNWVDIGLGAILTSSNTANSANIDLEIHNNTVYIGFTNEDQKSMVIKYDLVTSINQIPTLNQDISTYPNPTKAQLTIEGVEGIESIRILTMDGKVMQTITSNSNTISVEALPQGIYTIEVITKEGIGYKSFVKQ